MGHDSLRVSLSSSTYKSSPSSINTLFPFTILFRNMTESTSTSSSSSTASGQHAGRSSNEALFPYKLHEMLDEAEKRGEEHIISWIRLGTAFIVRDVPEFVNRLLPRHFKQSKYKSFQRQLNLWNFERLTSGPDKGAYFHPQFLRENPDLCKNLTRQRAKKASSGTATGNGSSPAVPASTAKIAMQKKKSASGGSSRRIVVPSAGSGGNNDGGLPFANPFMPRQVSESSLESFGELFRELDTSAGGSTLDLAEFEGFTFHLLEQERYEELNMEFKFTEGGSSQSHEKAARRNSALEEERSNVHSLLQELEQGTFGTPKTSFDAPTMGGPLCAV